MGRSVGLSVDRNSVEGRFSCDRRSQQGKRHRRSVVAWSSFNRCFFVVLSLSFQLTPPRQRDCSEMVSLTSGNGRGERCAVGICMGPPMATRN